MPTFKAKLCCHTLIFSIRSPGPSYALQQSYFNWVPFDVIMIRKPRLRSDGPVWNEFETGKNHQGFYVHFNNDVGGHAIKTALEPSI